MLLDTTDGGEEDPGLTSLYQDATFSQLSRTVAHTSTNQDVATASVHRLAVVLNTIDFQVESLSAPTWQLFDDGQVASVLEQCQAANNGTSSQELLIEVHPLVCHEHCRKILSLQVPRLHKILAAELATIQGSAAANQRALIQSEIEAILVYAVQWNAVQEGSAARRELLDAWRQVTETLITVTPAELLPSAGKQQVLLQMLQSLLNKVACEAAVPGLDTLVSSTVLLLLTSLRSTYSSVPERREVMGETYVGLLDATTGETTSSQTYSASLQVRDHFVHQHLSYSILGCSAGLA